MKNIARIGSNCSSVARADRLALLIDAAPYFARLAEALESARHSIFIVGWDVHSGIRLRRDSPPEPTLIQLLESLTEQHEQLQVRLLIWDCNVFCSVAREKLQTLRLGWGTSPQIRFELDGQHRAGACHHEKIVVIDDALAFVGGIDVTARRWDRSAHRDDDEQRTDPSGAHYPPYHDIQAAVSGPAAREIGSWVRKRWTRATGESPDPAPNALDRWPAGLKPDWTAVDIGLSHTDSTEPDGHEVRQIEQLYLDALSRARESIFIENQYLSSDTICGALVQSLQSESGPEICIVTPERVSGWLEEVVMGRLRASVVQRLRDADRWHRLRIWIPAASGGSESMIVHSKLCIVDDRFLTVGSANLSNRSMGLDTECNIFIEAADSEEHASIRRGIVGFRNRLLAEHLGCAPDELAKQTDLHGSVNRAVEVMREKTRSLAPLSVESDTGGMPGFEQLLDPERPLDWSDLVSRFFTR